ncbi:MAG: class I SAM-dependent methyltransferase [Bacteroidota bacterium]
MNFSEEWDKIYAEGQQVSVWPWSDLVTYVMRHSKSMEFPFDVLELGCGAGANIPFFKTLGMGYFALEGSQTIVNQLHRRYPEYKDTILMADFTDNIPFEKKFDLVVDRASLTHNTTDAIKRCLNMIKSHLNIGGAFIGIDWFSKQHSEFEYGVFENDGNTKSKFPNGQFKDVGRTHFSDKDHIIELFEGFEITKLEHKIITQEIPFGNYKFASLNFVAINKV